MGELIGIWFVFSAVIFGCICLFGMDFALKEKIQLMVTFEIFITSLIIGAHFLTGN